MLPNNLKAHKESFGSPLFIVGMPRSGTKLLRDLLNQHPTIGIPTVESHFIPHMIDRFGKSPSFDSNTEYFDRFYIEFTRTPFFWNMQRKGYILEKSELRRTADLTSWSSIFKTILTYYAPPGKPTDFIWGDKTPGYVNHIHLLKDLYPQAKFLHIIRDPRDYCLSVKNNWGKSLYRAASRWYKTLKEASMLGRQLGHDYQEVFYETLLDNPEQTLRNICLFLNCQYIEGITQLASPSENYGDAKGQTRIVQDNKEKYIARLSTRQIKRIEEIVYPVAKSMGYESLYGKEHKSLNPFILKLFTIYDGLSSARFHITEKGLRSGLWYFFSLHRRSSWR